MEAQVPEPSGRRGAPSSRWEGLAADLAKISIAAMVVREGDVCKDCGIAMGGVAKTPFRLKRTEGVLRRKKLDQDLVAKACQEGSEEIQPSQGVRPPFTRRK